MDSSTDKKTCVRCNKRDCAQCVEESGKSFCCQICCDEYKKRKDEQKKEEPVNVCNFC